MGFKNPFFLVWILALLQTSGAFRPPKCRGKEASLTQGEMDSMEECVKQYSTGGSASFADVPITRFGCIGKCFLQKQGLSDEKGIPLKENIAGMLNGTFDAEVAELARIKLEVCIDEKTGSIDVREKACKTYWPFVQCVMAAFEEVCAEPEKTPPTETTTQESN